MNKYAVVDLETTGGHASKHRVIEIGIVLIDDGQFVDEFQTYVNPEISIPRHITSLTGINDEDVENAPLFAEIADKIEEFLKDRIFVAQNVNFDYSFLKKEFELIDKSFSYQRLCTSRYARSSINGLKRSGLKRLAEYFQINNERPHRALSDAKTAAEILLRLLELDENYEVAKKLINKQKTKVTLPINVHPNDYDKLPHKPGVYFFKGKDDKPLYIGKAINIKKRVSSHFNGDLKSSKLQSFIRDIYRIDFQETGSDVLAYLFEDHLIRQYWPPFNKAQKNVSRKYGIIKYQDQNKNWRLAVNPVRNVSSTIKWFHYYSSAMQWMHRVTEEFELNPKYTGILSLMKGEEITDEEHNKNFELLLKSDALKDTRQMWVEKGRSPQEKAAIVVCGFRIEGYCFFNDTNKEPTPEEVLNNLEKLSSSGTTEKIIENYLNKKRPRLLSWL